jgi:HEAT repeat protein
LKKRFLILSLVFLAGIGTAFWLTGSFRREPLHKGKPVSYWVDEACRPNEFEAQREVLRIGPPAIPYLIDKLRGGTWQDRFYRRVHAKLPGPLMRLLPFTPPGPFDPACAAECLGQFGPEARLAVPALARLVTVTNRNDLAADRAIGALGAIGPNAANALPQLRRALEIQTSLRLAEAAWAIWRIGRETNLVFQVSTNLIASAADEGGAMNAALVLRELGPAAAPAVPLLLRVFYDPARTSIRANVASALARIGAKEEPILSALRAGIADTDLIVRASCASGLWRLDESHSREATPIIVDWVADWNRRFERKLTFAKATTENGLNPQSAIPALRELLKSESGEVRQIAAESLEELQADNEASKTRAGE